LRWLEEEFLDVISSSLENLLPVLFKIAISDNEGISILPFTSFLVMRVISIASYVIFS
jgi:hypothetical protein